MPFLAERICGICGFVHSTAYVQALENAVGVEAPLRARYIRSIVLELERIHSHLLWLGIAGHILGFDTVLMQTWRMREPVMWLMEKITGNRKSYGMNLVGRRPPRHSEGGARRDRPGAGADREGVAEGDRGGGRGHAAADAPVEGRRPQHAQTRASWARSVRPRAARTARSTSASTIPTRPTTGSRSTASGRSTCDAAGRTLVRLEETLESIRQVKQLLAEMPDGPIMHDFEDALPPGREGISAVEAPPRRGRSTT